VHALVAAIFAADYPAPQADRKYAKVHIARALRFPEDRTDTMATATVLGSKVNQRLVENLCGHVQALAGDIGERHVWCPRALAAAALYIEHALTDSGYEVRRQRYEVEAIPCVNLEAEAAGSDRDRPMLVVGAHYDTVPGSPGADDNASGIAALLEIARLLRTARLRSTVRCVAFVNEEAPFFSTPQMGSRVYVRAVRARGDRIALMLSLEMLGYYSSRPHSQRYPPVLRHFYPDKGNFVAFVSNLRSTRALRKLVKSFRAVSDFPAAQLVSPEIVPGVAWSDQFSFWQAGYPAVMVTDTAFYRYIHYHSPSDTVEKLDFASMARVTAGIGDAVVALAR
jgi:Iap family predicted aminopeptidase